jgi:orotate phosphoribosyltransferase
MKAVFESPIAIRNTTKNSIRYIVSLQHRKNLSFYEKVILCFYRMYKHLKVFALRKKNPHVAKAVLGLRASFRGRWHYVTIEELSEYVTQWVKQFPENYDVVVGVPRSGLMVASMIGGKLGKPITTPELFSTHVWMSRRAESREVHRVLLVDDSFKTGASMQQAKETLLETIRDRKISITTASVIVSPGCEQGVDLFYARIASPRIFEWNLLHDHKGVVAVDMDGVLCKDPPPLLEEDEAMYRDWISTVEPYLIPHFTIDVIVSNRLEKYRSETEAWLKKQRVSYRELRMWNLEEAKMRREGSKARYKVQNILEIKPFMFWESSRKEAEEIVKATRVPVWCVEDNIVLS